MCKIMIYINSLHFFFNINLMYSVCKRLRKQEGVSKVLNKEI